MEKEINDKLDFIIECLGEIPEIKEKVEKWLKKGEVENNLANNIALQNILFVRLGNLYTNPEYFKTISNSNGTNSYFIYLKGRVFDVTKYLQTNSFKLTQQNEFNKKLVDFCRNVVNGKILPELRELLLEEGEEFKPEE